VFIYKVTNKKNGKVYIGKTVRPVDVRWAQHLSFAKMSGGCPYLGAAIRKYGSEAFEVEQLVQATSEDELNRLEKEFIQQFQSYRREFGYNLTLGGDGGLFGYSHSPETRAKIALGRQGVNHPMYGKHQSFSARQKISQNNGRGFLGKAHTLESRKQMGARGEYHPNFGKQLPLETRQKIQEANSKTYEFLSPTGNTTVIINLKAFCKEQGLNAPHMNSVYYGKRKQHKGWTRCSI
jgi:group I intron endonuclease